MLEPETWIGKRFPLLEYIDIGEQLTQGEWLVVLYHHDCPTCLSLIEAYERKGTDIFEEYGASQILLIEMPPFSAGQKRSPSSFILRGKLANVRKWFASTPIEIQLDQGIVTRVFDGRH